LVAGEIAELRKESSFRILFSVINRDLTGFTNKGPAKLYMDSCQKQINANEVRIKGCIRGIIK
jgi:hypothetical protein